MNKLKYNPNEKDSIYSYAKGLLKKTFRDVISFDLFDDLIIEESLDSYADFDRKGGLGEIIEKYYFGYEPDNKRKADFDEAKVELKVTPYKKNKDGTLSAKERMSITMINYFDIVHMDFYNSNVWKKIENILIIYYLWTEGIIDRLDYVIDYVYMYSPSKQDLKIIIEDFIYIQKKILDGKAHELSEADTLYLGAATKSSDSSKLTKQPFSNIQAKPRAFTFKNSYMTYLLRNSIAKKKSESIVKNEVVDNFQDFVVNKINVYKNKSDKEMFKDFFGTNNLESKAKHHLLAYKLLGVNGENAEEFEKGNIVVKTIRREENGSIKESVSFPAFNIKELIKEDWEGSNVYNFFSETKFLFVVFQKKGDKYFLKGSKFWNMPVADIDSNLKEEWLRARDTFLKGVKFNIKYNKKGVRVSNDLPKKSNTKILHVRPHASKSFHRINGIIYGNGDIRKDTDELPNGDLMTKQCFWLNNDYIKNIIKKI